MTRRTVLGTVLLVLALAAATGCNRAPSKGDNVATVTGSKGPGGSGSRKPLTNEERAELARKYTACMKEHGVNVVAGVADSDSGGQIEVPNNGGANEAPPDAATLKKATEACRQFEPSGGDLGKFSPQELEQLREYTKCMRDNGVDMPDPDDQGAIVASAGPGMRQPLDPGSDVMKRAQEKCRNLQPNPPTGGNG